ncbi:MAG: alpha-amylase family glycosyl hydrolase [Candidatus Edwardsbacteria bacterium]|jgi:glycosidase|nr:alpha-amylase family glycosyl hydrolase [Candidatus Edwardsbacteria bacterium]
MNDRSLHIILPSPAATSGDQPLYEFHISADCRARYAVDTALFTFSGNVVFADLGAAQDLAESINQARDAKSHPELAVRAGLLAAMGLVDELLHYVVAQYRARRNPAAFAAALAHLADTLTPAALDACLLEFVRTFPPLAVHRKESTPEQYLAGATGGRSHREVALEELLLLRLANENPGFAPFAELFDDSLLKRTTKYEQLITDVETFFQSQPTFGPLNQSLVAMLRMPAKASPRSLADQLAFIRQHWLTFLPADILEKLFRRLLTALDVIREEDRPRGGGPGPAAVLDFSGGGAPFGGRSGRPRHEPEAFSPDHDWMPEAVLVAKNTHVWLFQLSRQYRREIRRLDQIPDQELDLLRERGINGLWLIGVWERSPASAAIKRICGNPEALSSAYSLYDYVIAQDLGGDEAYWNLKHRALERGVRIAVDMVPNHTGVFSRWVVEHPDWFVQLDRPPFPSYSFNGPDLSHDPSVVIQIEDGYWSKSDAAVVFKRHDRNSGQTRYIYHGNDGTHMPWNDTAQLNFLLPAVRQAVIGQILHVARYSSIIRFDAAMTLAKQHYQRLWFPEPGSGGDIPSRAQHGLSWQEFDAVFPREFWREVVDRVAAEAPQTLLLAEAFWLMEGYFVRTLGMHRVYNSAFMNMLKREDNEGYRRSLRNVLEFNPEILGRFVNFMNNPDEEPAAVQFGKGDKYFGVCLMMATLPGLPMFGHGQVEGFYEKYGMEYGRSYWDEHVDQGFVERHQREIFPLLRRRRLFSGAAEFLLYDVVDGDGRVHQDVYAYSNRRGGDAALVVYNNSFERHAGWIDRSVPYRPGGGPPRTRSLAEGLGLAPDGWYSFRDLTAGLEYLRTAEQLRDQGLFVQLDGYRYNAFADFRRLDDPAGEIFRLAQRLDGRGVPDIVRALWQLRLEPVMPSFDALFGEGLAGRFARIVDGGAEGGLEGFTADVAKELGAFEGGCRGLFGDGAPPVAEGAVARLREIHGFLRGSGIAELRRTRLFGRALALLDEAELPESLANDGGARILYCAALLPELLPLAPDVGARRVLWDRLATVLERTVNDPAAARAEAALAELLFEHGAKDFTALWDEPAVQRYLLCNWHNDVLWFNRERFQALLYWRLVLVLLENRRDLPERPFAARRRLAARGREIVGSMSAAEAGRYDHRLLADALRRPQADNMEPLGKE